MTKKSFYTIFLAVILLLSTVMLFACGGGKSGKDAFTQYDIVMTEMGKDATLFSKKTINSIETNYYLNDFYSKDEDVGTPVYLYNHYVNLAATGLNFIEKYYPMLENISAKGDYNKLIDDANSLNEGYKLLKVEHDNLTTNTAGVDFVIYNGYFARYRSCAKEFINQVYSCALNLGQFLADDAGFSDDIGKASMQTDELVFYVNYNTLKVQNDYKIFLMDSCKGVALDETVYLDQILDLVAWSSQVASKDVKAISAQDAKVFKDLLDNVSRDRDMVKKSYENFSFYDYVNAYDSSLLAYSKSNEHAAAYYAQIEEYANILDNLREFIVINVVA